MYASVSPGALTREESCSWPSSLFLGGYWKGLGHSCQITTDSLVDLGEADHALRDAGARGAGWLGSQIVLARVNNHAAPDDTVLPDHFHVHIQPAVTRDAVGVRV